MSVKYVRKTAKTLTEKGLSEVKNATILKIQEIVNAEPFSAKEARNEICAINLEHPENLVIYGLLFSQNSSGIRIVDADKECLICDLQWKQYYLSAKCVGKSIDEMRKELCGEAEHF